MESFYQFILIVSLSFFLFSWGVRHLRSCPRSLESQPFTHAALTKLGLDIEKLQKMMDKYFT